MKQHVDLKNVSIGVVGAGSWGTALADLLGRKGFQPELWAFETEVKEQIETDGENKLYLPGFSLSRHIRPSNDIAKVVSEKDLVLIAVPSHVMRETTEKIHGYVSRRTTIVSASKGIENKTHLTMSGVLKEILTDVPSRGFAVLSGPSFAREVGMQFPTVISAASENPDTARFVQHIFATSYFRVYTNDDMIGVELGGAVKNVIAIAAGIIDGLGLGLNTRAALVTRGLTEIRRLGLKLGANPRTFSGIAGVGDLVLTCTGDLSRNHTVGKKIGEGMKLGDVLKDMQMVAEGVKTAKSVYDLSQKLDIEMPISHEVYHILYDDISAKEACLRLMTRDLKQELDEQ